jgi:DNA replication protein
MYDYECSTDTSTCFFKNACSQNNCEARQCVRFMETDYLLGVSNLSERDRVVEKLEPQKGDETSFKVLDSIRCDVVDFVKQGGNLYVFGDVGNGKTSWAKRILLNYFAYAWEYNGFTPQGIFINVPTYLAQVKNSFKKDDGKFDFLQEYLPIVPLVVIDDITTVSSYDNSVLLNIIDQRYTNGVATIFTSNLSQKELTESLGKRTASRVWSTSIKVQIKGKDMRCPRYGITTDNQ